MKRTSSVIIVFALVASLCACNGKEPEGTAENTTGVAESTAVSIAESTAESTVEITSGTAVTTKESTAANTTAQTSAATADIEYGIKPDNPAGFPGVVTADKYEKEAVDVASAGLKFTHSLEIPKIDSEKPGAVALNNKISADYARIFEDLKLGKEGAFLYKISYTYAGYDGMLSVCVNEYVGIQYSEGGYIDTFYYYDAVKDCEISFADYISHFGYTEDALAERSRRCNEYYYANEYDNEVNGLLYRDANGGLGNAPMTDKIGFAEVPAGRKCDILGCAVTENSVITHFLSRGYVNSVIKCELYYNLKPVHPLYAVMITPAADSSIEGIKITFDNGKVISAAANPAFSSLTVFVTSSAVVCKYNTQYNGFRFHKAIVNGKEFEHMNYIDYTSIDELKSIEIIPDK